MNHSKEPLMRGILALAIAVVITTSGLLAGTAHRAAPPVAWAASNRGGAGGYAPGRRAAVVAALRRRLDREHLSYRWVVCVNTPRRYQGQRIWRCNVNFGDPHVVQYCAVLLGDRLLTDHENAAIKCGRQRETYSE